MALKDIWKDLVDGVSEIDVDDINNIADAVIDIENEGVSTDLSNYYTKQEVDAALDDKMDGYTVLDTNSNLDRLEDGWYHLPYGHDSFDDMLGHNYPHTLYQTSANAGYMVQIAMCPQSIMWRSVDGNVVWSLWHKLSLGVIDNLASTDKTSALSANQGKMLNDKIGDIETLLGGI